MLLALFLALTNSITTSSSYDGSVRSPFRIEVVKAQAEKNQIKLSLKYYINTQKTTDISFRANDEIKKDLLSPTKAKKSLRNIILTLPNDGENNTIDLKFDASWKDQEFILTGKLYFDDNSEDSMEISEPGSYKYKVVKDIIFKNDIGQFSYKYDNIYFQILTPYINQYLKVKPIFTQTSDYDYSIITKHNDEVIKSPKLFYKPGKYSSLININYQNGQIRKKIKVKYKFIVKKNYIGECDVSYYCITEGEVYGKLKEVKTDSLTL